MTVTVESDGKTLVHCFAGCSPQDIVGALGLSMTDLFPDDLDDDYKKQKETQFKREQFMRDYRLVKLVESDLRRGRKHSEHDKEVFRKAVARINQYKFNADEVYQREIQKDVIAAAMERAYYEFQHKTLEEKYGQDIYDHVI